MANFRPSIHGWPFGNSYNLDVQLPFKDVTLKNLGYCGGMCWTALERFFSGTIIDRNTRAPSQGEALYQEILQTQLESLDVATLEKIYLWQTSPDLGKADIGHLFRTHSIGHMTQEEWPNVRTSLDNFKPITLTLIASSNDVHPEHLENNHRVVAYGYDVRQLQDGEWVHGEPNSDIRRNIRHVTIFIYDPNHPDDDDVCLGFYTGCPDSWIGLSHTYGNFHGFFLDDKNRNYASSDSTDVWINSCVQTGISSATLAAYDLTFSWKCAFIPYFSVQVDGQNWQYNATAKGRYMPAVKVNKQCPLVAGNLTIKLALPRALSRVSVRLLDSDAYTKSIQVDALPAILCFPYVHTRAKAAGDEPVVCDTAISDADLFIKVAAPTEAKIQQFETSPFRWVKILHDTPIDTRTKQDDLTTGHVVVLDVNRLGNLTAPIFGNIIEKNLASPTRTSGILAITTKTSQAVQVKNIPSLNPIGQRIFDGFGNNPPDYDNDTKVDFTCKSIDRFGAEARGTITLYGQSIIHERLVTEIRVVDPTKLSKLEVVARELIERGLVDLTIALPEAPEKGPFPPQRRITDPQVLLGRLREDSSLSGNVKQTLNSLWNDHQTWKEIWITQSEILKQSVQDKPTKAIGPTSLAATRRLALAEQSKYDAVITHMIATKAIARLSQTPSVIERLELLSRGLARVVGGPR